MKILHLADLHLGKTLHTISMISNGDQPRWIDRILSYIKQNKPDAVVIAGDVYDRGVPAREAVPELSRLLAGISKLSIPVYLVAGNHDGGERLEFLSEILQNEHVYIVGTVHREMMHITQDPHDGFGPVTFWLMPYLFPAAVRTELALGDEISSFSDAVKALLEAQDIDWSARNVLVAHQTVLNHGAEPDHSKSETAIGGVGAIDASVFDGFDYVALGHIHGAQSVGSERIRYAGSPLCYHFSESNQQKGPLMITLRAKGEAPQAKTDFILPLHRVRPIMKGKLADIIQQEENSSETNAYVSVVLTDEWVQPDTHETLSRLFESHQCTLLDLSREPENTRKADDGDTTAKDEIDQNSIDQDFLEFYRKQTGKDDPDEKDAELIRFLAGMISEKMDLSVEELSTQITRFTLNQEENA